MTKMLIFIGFLKIYIYNSNVFREQRGTKILVKKSKFISFCWFVYVSKINRIIISNAFLICYPMFAFLSVGQEISNLKIATEIEHA